MTPSETVVVCGKCRRPLGEPVVAERHPDGSPAAWERNCPCGGAKFVMLDGGTLDLNALPEPGPDAGDFKIWTEPPG